ncbi:copper resistance protein CopC/CopD [Plantactinospora sp. S1510]|uniref:Copper resistance protein CopC/CopD n=1 Tax=Plantactinospora alkalitolerans TaxID=2789879 RepID=A0ABS0GMP0_9ACTN|nr:copper resistance protein CopC [Plantactinospora alkalitolerans]MBF9127446.1 copper resistance protein CopC/CopD [Plantactinospora alkalitolerans]
MSDMIAANRRWLARAGAGIGLLLAALALLLGPAMPASAHAVLVSSSPAADAVLSNAPVEVVLTFSEAVREVPDKIRILGPDGARVNRGDPTFNGAVVTIPVDPAGPRGTYLVSYRVISADSHPVAGAYTYSVGAPSTPPSDSTADEVHPAVGAAVRVFKFLGYAGLLLLIGPVLVLSLLWPRRLPRHGPSRLIWTGIGLIVLSTVGAIWLQVPYTTGGGPFAVSGSALGDVLGSTFGAAHLVRLGILAAAAILLRPLIAGRAGRSDQILLTVLGVAGLGTWPIAGHGAASPVPAVSVVVDVVHLAGMAVWLGGLVMLGGFLLRRANDRELDAILPVWSRWATVAVSALLLAGVVQALIEVSTPSALVSTTYGRLIIAKVVLFALVIAVAAYSRQLVRRRVPADGPVEEDLAEEESVEGDLAEEEPVEEGSVETESAGEDFADGTASGPDSSVEAARPVGSARRIRRAVWAELAITAVVLALSAILVQTPPARTADTYGDAGAPGYYTTTLTSSIYSLQVEVDPAKTGSNSMHLYAYTLDNKPLPVAEWRATAALPDRGIEPIEIPLLPLTPSHATGEISLPSPGNWLLSFTVRLTDIDQATVTSTVPIT